MHDERPARRTDVEVLKAAPVEGTDWEGCTAWELERHWRLPRVLVYRIVGSTNDEARKLAGRGAPSGTLVIADEQRAGRGRGGRTWASPPGVGLWCSLVLRTVSPEALSTLPLRIALEVAGALDPWTASAVLIKWPNDLLLGERKVGGILCEAFWDGPDLDHVVVGIGLNLLQSPDDFPADIRELATSVRIGCTVELSRFEVATAVVGRLRALAVDGAPRSDASLRDEFAARDALAGRFVEIREPETGRPIAEGTARGVTPEGALLVEAEGDVVAVRAGTVRLRLE
jgi:BirA family transcriptional regulator, biotin operon repressor / biotin---[acetyl-CoA-carboxylase] ligase